MATFLANEINAAQRDVTGTTEQISDFFQIFFIIMHYLQNITLSTFTEITRNTK